MIKNEFKKFALLSHILPPSPSGQAVMIYRLLEKIPPKSYCLVSRQNYNLPVLNQNPGKLTGKYYHLRAISQPNRMLSSRISFLSEPFKLIWDVFSRTFQIVKILKKEKCRALIACTGEICDLASAYLIKVFFKIPIIIYIFDDPIYQQTGLFQPLVKKIVLTILRQAQNVIVPNEFLQKKYQQDYKIQSFVIHNPILMPNLQQLDKKKKILPRNKINIVFTGAIYSAHYDAFRNLIKAVNLTKMNNLALHIFTAESLQELKKEGIKGKHVFFHSHLIQSDISVIQRQADILFLPLAFHSPIPEIIKTSAPGKMGDYLSVVKPILVHVPQDSYISWYFKKYSCGVVVSQEKPQILAEAIAKIIKDEKLRRSLEENALKQVKKDFDLEKIRQKFIKFLGAI